MCYNIFHILKFSFQVLQLSVVSQNRILVRCVLTSHCLLLDLHLLQLFSELACQCLQLLAVMYMLLQLIANELTVLLCDLLLLQQLPLEFPQVVELHLLLLVALTLFVVGDLGLYELLLELLLQLLGLGFLFEGFVQLALLLSGLLSQGVDLVGDLDQLCAGLVQPNSEFVQYFLRHIFIILKLLL